MTQPIAPQVDIPKFSDLGLASAVVEQLAALGYTLPTPIQAAAIPVLLAGRDLIGQAATGTGKTAAFGLPIVQQHLAAPQRPAKSPPFALILVPTRELATQVAEALSRYGQPARLKVLALYGGQAYEPQLRALHRGVDVVVATPGRALDHMSRTSLDLSAIQTVVLDEADEMLAMGFLDDMEAILAATPETRQTVLFSATLPPRMEKVTRRYLRDPASLMLTPRPSRDAEAPLVREEAYIVPRPARLAGLRRILELEQPELGLIFCRTRDDVENLAEALNDGGFRTETLHGGMSQAQRERVIGQLKAGKIQMVIATDVAARGLHVDQLSHVINVDVPNAPEVYVHRIGRVGRAGRTGTAITLAEPRDKRRLKLLEELTRRPLPIRTVPSLQDLEAARRDRLAAKVRASLAESTGQDMGQDSGLEGFGDLARTLGEESSMENVARAALAMLYAQAYPKSDGGHDLGDDRDFAPPAGRERRPRAGAESDSPRDRGAGRAPFAKRPQQDSMRRLFVGIGLERGVRPKDLVGAIAGEAGVTGKDIGSIDIGARFAVVEVAAHRAEHVMTAMRETKIKGIRVNVREFRDR